MEDEFFDIERFKGRDDFFQKVTSYIWYYNFLRKNSNRKDKSPLEILKETKEYINPQVMLLPALDLDELLNQKLKVDLGGHHVPKLSFAYKAAAMERTNISSHHVAKLSFASRKM